MVGNPKHKRSQNWKHPSGHTSTSQTSDRESNDTSEYHTNVNFQLAHGQAAQVLRVERDSRPSTHGPTRRRAGNTAGYNRYCGRMEWRRIARVNFPYAPPL